MKDKLLALLKTLGLLTDDKVDAVSKELDKLELDKKTEAIDPSKVSDPATKQILEQLAAQQEVNKQLLATLNAERTEREKAVQVQKDEAKKAAEQKVKDLVERAKKEGKIVQAKEKWLTDLAASNLALAEEWVKDAPVDKSFKSEQKPDDKSKSDVEVNPSSLGDYVKNKAEHTKAATAAFAESRKN